MTHIKNWLRQGSSLAYELPSCESGTRRFIAVHGYPKPDYNTNKILPMKYSLRIYSVLDEFIQNDWDVHEEDLFNSVHVTGIADFEQLMAEIHAVLPDFDMDVLVPFARTDAPIE